MRYKEIENFLDNLNYLEVENRIIAVGKDIPFLYECSPKYFNRRENQYNINNKLINDFYLLKRFGYVIDKITTPQRPSISTAALSLHISHDCNMACKYCFLKESISRGPIKLMSKETARKAVKFFYKRIDKKKTAIIFMGGEPLLNLPAIEAVLAELKYFSGYDTRLSIVTNGTLLDRKTALWLHKNKIRISISYDGIKKENDRNRKLKNGASSSGLVINSIRLLQNLGIEISGIKATISKNSSSTFTDYLKSLIRLPINPQKIHLAYEAHYPPQKALGNDLIYQKLKFFDQVKKWVEEGKQLYEIPLIGMGTLIYTFTSPWLKSFDDCGFSHNKVVVTPEGNFYFCDVVIGRQEFYVGNIREGPDEAKIAALQERYKLKPDYCNSCWIKSFCEQHCPHVRIDEACLSNRCALSRMEAKKSLEIYLRLNLQNILSLYDMVEMPVRLKRQTKKLLYIAYATRSILYERTEALRPLNIFPYYG